MIYRKRHFNLIEILLAVSVVVIGFVGLLMPVSHAWDSMRKAKEKFYSELATNNLLSWVKAKYRTSGQYSSSAVSGVGHTLLRIWSERELWYPVDDVKTLSLTEELIPEEGVYRGSGQFPSCFKLWRDTAIGRPNVRPGAPDQHYHFRMQFTTKVDGNEIVEFDCLATASIMYTMGANSNNGFYMNWLAGVVGARIIVSWPVEVDEVSVPLSGREFILTNGVVY